MARAIRDRTGESLASKSDLRELGHRLKIRLSRVEQKIADAQTSMIEWFTGVTVAQAAAIMALLKPLLGAVP